MKRDGFRVMAPPDRHRITYANTKGEALKRRRAEIMQRCEED